MNWEKIKENYPNAYNLYILKMCCPRSCGYMMSYNSKIEEAHTNYKILAYFFKKYNINYSSYWNSKTFTKAFDTLEKLIRSGKSCSYIQLCSC